ncbi:MAG: NUDIX domain-containing protein [Parcubacteria group bacterium]
MPDELIDIFNESNEFIGMKKMKSEAHRDGLRHRAAHIWIYNSKGEILLQLRATDKLLFPDMWDIAVAGHVAAGEDPAISALRELEEEIGLKVKKEDLQFDKVIKVEEIYKKIDNKEFNYVYFLKFDGSIDELKKQDEEVQELKFMPIEELETELKNNYKKFTPHGQYWFDAIGEVKKRIGKRE